VKLKAGNVGNSVLVVYEVVVGFDYFETF